MFLVVLYTNDYQTWEMKNEKQLQKIVEKLINGLKASKKLTRMEISRQPYFASSNSFFSNFFYIFCPYHMKGPKVL